MKAAIALLLLTASAPARPYEAPLTRATIREQLCEAKYHGTYWDGGATVHALRCELRYRRP